MANDPPFATLNHVAGDLGIPSESALRRIGISTSVMLGLTCAGITRAADQSIEEQLIDAVHDAMHKVFGVHPGFRANHAKGVSMMSLKKGGAERSAALARTRATVERLLLARVRVSFRLYHGR